MSTVTAPTVSSSGNDVTPLDLETIEAREKAAFAELIRILSVDQQTHMSIPANPSRDTDLLISASLKDVPALVAEVKRLRSLLAEVEWEYGVAYMGSFENVDVYHPLALALQALDSEEGDVLVKRTARRPAGPWEVVPHE